MINHSLTFSRSYNRTCTPSSPPLLHHFQGVNMCGITTTPTYVKVAAVGPPQTSETPTNAPTKMPSQKPVLSPTATPTTTPTPKPSFKPTPLPSAQPVDEPTVQPTTKPTDKPVPKPSSKPFTPSGYVPSRSRPTRRPRRRTSAAPVAK